jgi:hypothetical protein
LKRHKSPGSDQIPAELIQAGGKIFCSKIHKLINYIWNKEKLPDQWKESIILPSHKKRGKTAIIILGITTINFIQKFTNILLSKLSPYINEINGDHQCGFRPNRSSTDQMFFIHRMLEKKWEYDETVHQLFVDFMKAYDSVRREVDRVWGTHETS